MQVNVTLEERLDGGLRAYSDELPGLILSHSNRMKVLADVEPAVRALLEHRGVKPEKLTINATFVRSQDLGRAS